MGLLTGFAPKTAHIYVGINNPALRNTGIKMSVTGIYIASSTPGCGYINFIINVEVQSSNAVSI